ncbi:MAG: hypothetical protein HRU09_00120 [Oligoflexales bacterium]|nr:hypothetical protein [Oligoflexales bacterium]
MKTYSYSVSSSEVWMEGTVEGKSIKHALEKAINKSVVYGKPITGKFHATLYDKDSTKVVGSQIVEVTDTMAHFGEACIVKTDLHRKLVELANKATRMGREVISCSRMDRDWQLIYEQWKNREK